MRGSFPLLVVTIFLVQSVSGCTSVFVAHVPEDLLTDGWAENKDRRSETSQFLGLGLTQVTLVYDFDRNEFNGPYPAEFVVITIKILGGASRNELFDRLDDSLQKVLEKEGIELDQDSRREGDRTLAAGQSSIYFTYAATAGAGASFFDSDRRIRILGEVFNDHDSDVTVLLIGLAQITGASLLTGREDTSQWRRIVADPDGTIEGYQRDDGFAYNVVSHG